MTSSTKPENIRFVTGDIFTTRLDSIGHGVNLQGVMGSGIAAIIKKKFPAVFPPYREACFNKTLQIGGCLPVEVEPGFWVLNLASQNMTGKDARLEWVEQSVQAGADYVRDSGLKGLALPRIGAGVGGLQWLDVRETLIRVADRNRDIKLEIWSLPGA